MKATTPNATIEKKNGKNWETVLNLTEPVEVYERMTRDLTAKYINKCTYIKRVVRVQMYTHLQVIVYYDNDVRTIYNVAN